MTMDKLWAINAKILDPTAPRFTAINTSGRVPVTLSNGPTTEECRSVALHKKNPAVGTKVVSFTNRLWLEQEDAASVVEGEEVTLMDWGNCFIRKIVKSDNGTVVNIDGEISPSKNFKDTKKFTWLADINDLVPCVLQTFGHLITVPKLEKDCKLEDFIAKNSKTEVLAEGHPGLRQMKKGDVVQLERKSFYIVDRPYLTPEKPLVLIAVPSGKIEVETAPVPTSAVKK